MVFKVSAILLALMLFAVGASGQRTEVTITLSEQFFDSLLDAVFRHAGPPEFPLANNRQSSTRLRTTKAAYVENQTTCPESVKLLRELSGVKTAVRFRDGRISVPLAFTGNYNPPFLGCVNFTGVADTIFDLFLDGNRLIARARVQNVSLNGTGGVGGTVIARLIQSSIDGKINPIEVVSLDKLSFAVPIRNTRGLQMRAVGLRHEVVNSAINIHIAYEFAKQS